MKRATALVAILIVAALTAAPPEPVELRITAGDRPSILTLAVEIDSRPLTEIWADTIDAVFADSDVNGDGFLDEREARRVLSALRVRQLGWGYLWAEPRAAEWSELDTSPRDGRVLRDELAAYYHRHQIDGPQIGVGQAPDSVTLTTAILAQLDTDHDGRVTEAEWKAADVALRPLDRDDDEMIRPTELVARLPYPGSAGTVALAPATPGQPLPKQLADLPLRRAPAGRSSKEPAATLIIRLGSRKLNEPDVAFMVGEPKGIALLAYTTGSSLLDDFALDRKVALDRFTAADANRDGSLDAAEIKSAGYAPLRDHFAFADRDGDGRLTKPEWESYLKLRAKYVNAQVTVTLLDHGHGLFELIDQDGDGALSVRELRNAWRRLMALGCVKDGRLEEKNLPHTIRVIASRGPPRTLLRTPPRTGPAWFLAMDRNRDGDVSRREFLGTDEAFRRLDADGDGLISAAEAVAITGR